MPTTLLPGFEQYNDLLNSRLVEDNVIETVDTIVRETVELHNQQTQNMLSLFCDFTTDHQRRFQSPFQAYLQPHDGEFARMQPVKQFGVYDIAFPLAAGGIGFGWTRLQRIKKTVRDVNDRLVVMLDADRRYNRYNILAALFANTDYSYEDEDFGTLTVKPLANGDSQEYLTLPGAESPTTANHFAAQANAIDDSHNPFPTIYDTLSVRPENGEGRIISFVPTANVAAVKALTSFIEAPDPDVREGIGNNVLVGDLSDAVLPGEVIGKVGRVWVAEWRALPSNYLISIATGGPRPLAAREHPEPELQGFQAVADRVDHPYTERHFERRIGFGVQNRLSAHIQRVGNGTYAIPTGFTRADVM
jgi:hypothetical protein